MTAHLPPQGDEPGFGMAPPVLYNLVYCSRATPMVDDAQVQLIIAAARRSNPQHGITGMLAIGGGIFVQWLEGPRDSVTGLMAILQRDPRHEQIVMLNESEEVRERLFPDWDMELVSGDHVRDVLQDAHDQARDPQNARVLADLLAQLDGQALAGLATG